MSKRARKRRDRKKKRRTTATAPPPDRHSGAVRPPPSRSVSRCVVTSVYDSCDRTDLDPLLNRHAQLLRGRLTAAPGDEGLDLLLDAVLAQTRRALVEVLPDLLDRLGRQLAVEVEVHRLHHVGAVELVRRRGCS